MGGDRERMRGTEQCRAGKLRALHVWDMGIEETLHIEGYCRHSSINRDS
jgi:hypothetical protein